MTVHENKDSTQSIERPRSFIRGDDFAKMAR